VPNRYEVRPFTPELLDDAAGLRAADHARQRRLLPALDPAHEQASAVRHQLAEVVSRDGALGVFVTLKGKPAAYVVGAPKPAERWGPNVFVEAVAAAGNDIQAIREAYAAAAAAWVSDGRLNHDVIVSAADADQVQAWFSLSFGIQHVHALRGRATTRYSPDAVPGLTIRRKERRDIAVLAELGRVVPQHVHGSPVFSFIPVPSLEESLAESEEEFDDARFTEFVAEHDGRVIASAVGCALEESSINTGPMRPPHAGYLAHAAVLPEGRGLGAGRALGQTIIAWSRDAGYDSVACDWRSTNLEADRTWRGLGFEPSFYRLHRLIG
jgi:GNAT superfamily N-acetyltransferase